MTNQPTPPAGGETPPRRRARRRHVGRPRNVSTLLDEVTWRRVDARAARAGLALGAWSVLLAEDVAVGRPAVSEAQLEALVGVRPRVVTVGGAVNSVAAAEHLGRHASEAELAAVLGRLAARVEQAGAVLADAAAVYPGGGGARPDTSVGVARGRRAARDDAAGERRRRVRAVVTQAEYDRLAGAAAGAGLSVGAWLGQLLEDPAAARPLAGEAWGAVFGLRRALRRVATNLAQIAEARTARGQAMPPGLVVARGQVDDAIRACLAVQAAIAETTRGGAA